MINRITAVFDNIFKVPLALEALVGQYSRIIALDIKKFKHDYKVNDYEVQRYQQELQLNQDAKKHLFTLLF